MRSWLVLLLALLLGTLALLARYPASATESIGTRPPIWDPRLNDLNVTYHPAANCSQGCWRLIRADYLDKGQSGGLHHIFAKAFSETGTQLGGIPWRMAWPDGVELLVTKPPPDWGDVAIWDCYFPDQGQSGGYRAWMGDTESRSDVVRGMGLPYCHHVVFQLTWQWDPGGPPTPTPTRTVTPTRTATPRPTFPPGTRHQSLPFVFNRQYPAPQPVPTLVGNPTHTPAPPTSTPMPTRTPTPSGGYTGEIVQTFSNCGLTQIFGVVHDRNGNPQVGRRIRLTWDGNTDPPFEAISGSYPRPETDASGWEIVLDNRPIQNRWRVTILDTAGNPVSPEVLVYTVSTCAPTDVNVAKIRFRQQ